MYLFVFLNLQEKVNDQQYIDDNVLFYYFHTPYTYYISPKIGPISVNSYELTILVEETEESTPV